eukprot:XP_007119264.1 uncharacterized protein LOC102982075 [Physeter catodon]
MGCGLFKAPAPRLRLLSDLLPPPRCHSASSTSFGNEVISLLPIGCAGPSVTGSPAAVLASLGPQLPWLRGAGRCCVCGVRGGGESDCPILPTLSAPLAACPPLAPTSPQLCASQVDVEPWEETRAVRAGAGTAVEPGPGGERGVIEGYGWHGIEFHLSVGIVKKVVWNPTCNSFEVWLYSCPIGLNSWPHLATGEAGKCNLHCGMHLAKVMVFCY